MTLFSHFFYAIRFNMALHQLGVNPKIVNIIHRQSSQYTAILTGHSPQEAALFLLTMLPINFQYSAPADVVIKWSAKGKVRLSDHTVQDAIHKLEFYNSGLGALLDLNDFYARQNLD